MPTEHSKLKQELIKRNIPSEIFVDEIHGEIILLVALRNSKKMALAPVSAYEILNGKCWFMSNGYAAYYEGGKSIFMQNLIMTKIQGKIIDHANRNRLDNRLCNLRYATYSENQSNRLFSGKSGFKGVRELPSGRFRVQVCFEGNTTSPGVFDHLIEAALIYDQWARVIQGEFAATNFPPIDVKRYSSFTI